MNEVWSRVAESSGYEPEKAQDRGTNAAENNQTMLQRFIQSEADGVECYKRMSARSSRNSKLMFARLANDGRANLKQLQMAYFILTGDSYTPKTERKQISSMLSALRERYIAETEGQLSYEKAAAATPDRKLSQLYIKLARGKARNADELEHLIEKVMG